MSGYTGNPDAEAEHAMILAENGINASQRMLEGPVVEECMDCGDAIHTGRVAFMRSARMKCLYCITCQPRHDTPGRVKMLDRIL